MITKILTGPNLSGKSEQLRKAAGLDGETADLPGQNAFISPNSTANFSGLAPTGLAEIELLSASERETLWGVEAMTDIGMPHCLSQNPYECSGGEQVVLAIVAALASKATMIGIDAAIEQLNASTRRQVLNWLDNYPGDIQISDNRAKEWVSDKKLTTLEGLGSTAFMLKNTLPSTPPAEVSLKNLSFSYNSSRSVFDSLNLHFKRGTFYRVAGKNGIGKSTLARILTGLLKPNGGKIYFDGEEVKPWKAPGYFASYSFQNPDYQLFASTIQTQLGSHIDVDAALQGLNVTAEEHPLDLPLAMRKRLAVLGALARKPNFLMLDEPTLGQDDAYIDWLVKQLEGRTGFVITHSKHFEFLPQIELGAV